MIDNTQLIEKLQADLSLVTADLNVAEAEARRLRWKADYIREVLQALQTQAARKTPETDPFAGQSSLDVAVRVLAIAGTPMKVIDIAEKAVEMGFKATSVEHARRRISSLISQNMRRSHPRVAWFGKSLVGLVHWPGKVPPEQTKEFIEGIAPENLLDQASGPYPISGFDQVHTLGV